ncbi:aminomethyltransferase [Halanaerobium saccharolyticum]|uniref:Aminomethyltransferase n=1 Tax=Halanaerobium saccharolyticum TaxID=43595 RepID=A0A4R7YRR8_9FIRM|nr:glycine cleavage system aminomethyltransferase GcvT [Halanaerobium saccharolyticum]RAK05443.1 aminomethyltransferase [Halanaerobium saccharolyticum]TDV99778.1 aminomethyltransferase [Halanaerobium saccharolyticum]TDX52000.1 aminomethyltransferase [Halanaerobium saccharolyticum]
MKKTPLNQIHKNLGAKMTDFGGWEMPVEYTGIIEEHQAVRNQAGLFDVSHMGEILVRGENAAKSLQKIITNDHQKLEVGKIIYTPICRPDGGIIDDLLVYCLQEDQYLMVVNASNIEKDFNWINDHLLAKTKAENLSNKYAMLALQGPESKKILTQLTDIDLNSLDYYRFRQAKAAGIEMIISRTGYTGELGYELYFEPEAAEKIWDRLMEAGSDFGLKACGLGARDTLRLEKTYPLYGNDIDETTNPYEAGLNWTVAVDKGDFIGREKLIEIEKNCCQRKLSPFKITGRGMARHGYVVYAESKKIGEVTSGSYSPTLNESIGLAYLNKEYTEPGTEIEIKIRKRMVKAEVLKGPFV